jgi:threonine dehydrogenase-like Zn-dependent dehydrogenase
MLSGICGSDLATVDGRSSRYFEDIVSFPFIPGHEIVGQLVSPSIDAHGHELTAGSRVVIQPVLGCEARSLPLCPGCQAGDVGRCENVSHGHLLPGLQTGFCADTGGGWSEGPLLAHSSQLFCVPDALSDDDAVVIEPMACAIHAAMRARHGADDTLAIIGAGTLGLGVVAAIDFLAKRQIAARPRRLIVGARYATQRQHAAALGADEVVPPEHLARAVRLSTRSGVVGPPAGTAGQLSGGAQVVIDCVGSEQSLEQALSIVAPGGRVVVVGMPGKVSLDLASLWHREVELVGAYAYGVEDVAGTGVPTFDLATEMVTHHRLGSLVSAHYPLERFEEALAHAGAAGRRGSIKIVFEVGPQKARHKRED